MLISFGELFPIESLSRCFKLTSCFSELEGRVFLEPFTGLCNTLRISAWYQHLDSSSLPCSGSVRGRDAEMFCGHVGSLNFSVQCLSLYWNPPSGCMTSALFCCSGIDVHWHWDCHLLFPSLSPFFLSRPSSPSLILGCVLWMWMCGFYLNALCVNKGIIHSV